VGAIWVSLMEIHTRMNMMLLGFLVLKVPVLSRKKESRLAGSGGKSSGSRGVLGMDCVTVQCASVKVLSSDTEDK
jgi:hypothetical protein